MKQDRLSPHATGSVVVFSAPSGSGKSTIINRLLRLGLPLHFSVSATSRQPRAGEVDGREYYFLSPDEFAERITRGDFIEYEEVYKGTYYGTLKCEVDHRIRRGEHLILDIDVKGALRVKKLYGQQALLIFISPPSLETLRSRLEGRGSDTPEVIQERLAKASYELMFADRFDHIVVNDDLEEAIHRVQALVGAFIGLTTHADE